MLLGMARGKVGSLVFYRKNGQQVTRAKAEKVTNPQTNGQLVQRAIAATIAQAYAAGKAIFDHSFQGKQVPAGSMNRFRKVNMDKLRALITTELAQSIPANECDGVVVGKGATGPVAFAYRISEGQLVQNLFSVAPDGTDANLMRASMTAPLTGETIAAYCTRNGIAAGDIYTIVAFGVTDTGWEASGDNNPFTQFKTEFGFVRLIVKASALTLTTTMDSATFSDIFTVETTNSHFVSSDNVTDGISTSDVVYGALTGSLGVIRSEENQKLRSTSDMVCPVVVDWGIKSPYLLDSWNPAIQSLQSDLILEGGNF